MYHLASASIPCIHREMHNESQPGLWQCKLSFQTNT